MPSLAQYAGQALVYAALAAFTGYFASRPVYHQVPDGMAQIKMALSHAAERVEDCRRLTPEEIAKLPPAERRPNTCNRQRIAVRLQLVIDEQVIYDEELLPTGVAADGPARAYQKFLVPAGEHRLIARLRDSRREGFDHEAVRVVELLPWQNLAIEFRAGSGFIFR